MKKKLSALLCIVMLLASCGMSPEEITTALEQAQSVYNNGEYVQAQETLDILNKAYKKMTDEQKVSYDALKQKVGYAIENAAAIENVFAEADSYLDQKLYYEANAVLDKLDEKYELPPMEKHQFLEKSAIAGVGIKNWCFTNALKEAEIAFNNSDDDKLFKILFLDMKAGDIPEAQKELYEFWKQKEFALRDLTYARSEYNDKRYCVSRETLSKIDMSLLNDAQKETCDNLNKRNEKAIEEIRRKIVGNSRNLTSEQAIALIKANEGSSQSVRQLHFSYSYYDKGEYYLVCATATAAADGTEKYRVYKKDGLIEYLGVGSTWSGDDSETT